MKYKAQIQDQAFEIEVDHTGEAMQVLVNKDPHVVDLQCIDGTRLFSLVVDNRSYEAFVEEANGRWLVAMEGQVFEVDLKDERMARLQKVAPAPRVPQGELPLKAPMPGLIIAVNVQRGDAVRMGQPLVILEAMKMENEVRAPRNGLVKEVLVGKGQKVDQGALLVILQEGD